MTATYITTTIPYVNARPHIGHALELVQADVLARYHRGARRRGPVPGRHRRQRAEERARRRAPPGVGVREFVDRNADGVRRARAAPLSLSFDDFIRTSRDPRHRPGVERLWRACAARRPVPQATTRACTASAASSSTRPPSCSTAAAPSTATAPERVSEENWFFRLSRYAGPLLELITSGRLRIEPAGRRNEVLALHRRRAATTFSVSRPPAAARGWGIPVPGDPTRSIYVWFDALGNYITALGYGQPMARPTGAGGRGAGERVHVIGKGILRFHAVYWPAMLLSAGQPLPTGIFVHDYLTVDGQKISKSAPAPRLDRRVEPAALAAEYGADAVRWWLLREVPRVGDADFTVERLVARADDELANGLGNLVNRVVAMIAPLPGRPAAERARPSGGARR